MMARLHTVVLSESGSSSCFQDPQKSSICTKKEKKDRITFYNALLCEWNDSNTTRTVVRRHTWVLTLCLCSCWRRAELVSAVTAGEGSLCRRPCGGSCDTSILRRSKQTTGTLVLPESVFESLFVMMTALCYNLYYYYIIAHTFKLTALHTPAVTMSQNPAVPHDPTIKLWKLEGSKYLFRKFQYCVWYINDLFQHLILSCRTTV